MSIDPDTLREMFAEIESVTPEEMAEISGPGDFVEPPIRVEEPPIRREEPPPSKQEIEAQAADELAKIASEEEEKLKSRHKEQRTKDSFIIYCPKGCRIRVKDSHRGKTGKCPRCNSTFSVPVD